MFMSIKIKNRERSGFHWEWGETEHILDILEKRPHCLCFYKLNHREKVNTGMKLDI